MTEQPALKTGDLVVIHTSRYGELHAMNPTPITRETKTQLLVGERRFRKSNLQEMGDFDSWTPIPELKRPDDPLAIRALEATNARRQLSRTIRAVRAWEADREDLDRLDAAITALTNYRHYTHGATK